MPRIKTKPKEKGDDIGLIAAAYMGLKAKEKDLQKELATHNKTLRAYAEKHGVADGSGHRNVIVSHAGIHVNLMLTRKSTVSIKGEAIDVAKEIFKDKPDVLSDLIEKVEVFRSDNMENLILHGAISEDEAHQMVQVLESFSFTPKILKPNEYDIENTG